MERRQELDGLIRLFEDYTIRRCWPQGSGQGMALSIVPTLILDLSDSKARAIRVTLSHDGRILAETSKFQNVWASETMPSDVRSEVEYALYRRGKNWALCAAEALSVLHDKEHECVENMWDSAPELFSDLLLGLIRRQIQPRDFDRLVFVVPSGERESKVRAALGALSLGLPSGADLLNKAQILSLPHETAGFAFLRNVQVFPEEEEQMLLLYNHPLGQAGLHDKLGQMVAPMRPQRDGRTRAVLFQWSQGEFQARSVHNEERLALNGLRHIAVCSQELDRVPDGIFWFHGEDELYNQAVANYVAWKPALLRWEVERQRRELEVLQRDVAHVIQRSITRDQALQRELQRQQQDVIQLEADIQCLRGLLQRARGILQRLASESSLGMGGKAWLHSELTSAQPQP